MPLLTNLLGDDSARCRTKGRIEGEDDGHERRWEKLAVEGPCCGWSRCRMDCKAAGFGLQISLVGFASGWIVAGIPM